MEAISPALLWGTLVVGGSSALAWIYFWMRVGGYVQRIDAADKRADAAEKRAGEAHEKVALLNAAFGLFQVQVAKEYASQATIREVEERLSRGIDSLQRSHSESQRTVHGRLDEILTAVARLHAERERRP
jgi:hypothetical protein